MHVCAHIHMHAHICTHTLHKLHRIKISTEIYVCAFYCISLNSRCLALAHTQTQRHTQRPKSRQKPPADLYTGSQLNSDTHLSSTLSGVTHPIHTQSHSNADTCTVSTCCWQNTSQSICLCSLFHEPIISKQEGTHFHHYSNRMLVHQSQTSEPEGSSGLEESYICLITHLDHYKK